MTGRQISKASHRMSGEVFVVRPVPASSKLSDSRLAEAARRDDRAIDETKADLKPGQRGSTKTK